MILFILIGLLLSKPYFNDNYRRELLKLRQIEAVEKDMVIVKVMAGLGNQMFEYALYRALLEKGKDAKLDIHFFDTFEAHNGYELKKVFNIDERLATSGESKRLGVIKYDFLSRLITKFIYRKKTHYFQNMEEGFGFIPEIFDMDNVFLQGYWQSEKYFMDIESIIRKDFTFKNELDEKNKKVARDIKNCESVSIHVRRGDYVSSPDLGGICNQAYYSNALVYMQKKLDNPKFFVFSDDMGWSKKNLGITEAEFIDWNTGKDSYKDMQLMSLCNHNIIANSSFSWWGAWLNNHIDKIVIAPDTWNKNIKMNTRDLVPNSWIKVAT